MGHINELSDSFSVEIQEELSFDRNALSLYLDARMSGPAALTLSQRKVFDAVLFSVRNKRNGLFFIDAPGGTGKSYVLNAILASVRLLDANSIAIGVAGSGIAATLLLMGRTFHSRFKAKLDVTEEGNLQISHQSELAKLIRLARIIVWDEAPMNHRYLLEALDRFLRETTSSTLPFGGKVILLAGDFRQVLPVVKRGSRGQTVDSVINRSPLWPHFQRYRLNENMRVLRNGNDERLSNFVSWLLLLGEGKIPTVTNESDYIELPTENCISINGDSQLTLKNAMDELISFVYPDLATNLARRNWLAERAVLAPVNTIVDQMNEIGLDLIPGEKIECYSADSTIDKDEATRFPTEYLNTISVNGIPPHRLVLKPGAPLMLLRNINPKDGLCNGTRLTLPSIHGQMLKCQIAGGDRDGNVVFLPRITFTPNESEEFHMQWKRRQFPVRTAFAMTINKSQVQSLSVVGVWLEEPVFAHGQLYVASSRVGHPDNIKYAVKPYQNFPANATRNVVYHEVFEQVTKAFKILELMITFVILIQF